MALPIRQRLSALTCLKAGPKAVLIEVCELHANGGKGCYASNGHLAKKLGTSERSITRAIAELEAAGHLVSSGQGKARALVPSAAVVGAYQPGPTGMDAATNLDKNGGQPSQIGEVGEVVNLAKNGSQPSQKWQANLAKNGSQPSQNASRVYGDDQNDQYNDQDDQRKALALAQKKIEQQATALAEASEDLAKCRATIAALRAENEKQAKELAAAGRTHQRSELPFDSPEFAAAWRDLQAAQGFAPGSARERAKVAQLLAVASSEHEAIQAIVATIAGNWTKFYKPDEPRNPTRTGQPERGAKPTAAGPMGARALAEHIAALDRQQREPAGGGGSLRIEPHGQPSGAYTGQGPA